MCHCNHLKLHKAHLEILPPRRYLIAIKDQFLHMNILILRYQKDEIFILNLDLLKWIFLVINPNWKKQDCWYVIKFSYCKMKGKNVSTHDRTFMWVEFYWTFLALDSNSSLLILFEATLMFNKTGKRKARMAFFILKQELHL